MRHSWKSYIAKKVWKVAWLTCYWWCNNPFLKVIVVGSHTYNNFKIKKRKKKKKEERELNVGNREDDNTVRVIDNY